MLERNSRAHMRPRAFQRDDRLALAARMLQRKARMAEGDLALGPRHIARQLPVTDGARNVLRLTHPGEDGGNRARLGGELALAGEIRCGGERALEPRGDRLRVERDLEPRRTLRAKIGRCLQVEAEVDGLILPVELTAADQRVGDRRQADPRVDVLDAPLGACVRAVIDDDDGAVLDAHVLEMDIAALIGRLAGHLGFGKADLVRLLVRAAPAQGSCFVAETHGEHGMLQDHAPGIDPAAEQVGEIEIERELRHREVGRAGTRRGVGDLGVGDDDVGLRGEQQNGRAVHGQVAPGLLLDAGRDARLQPVRREDEVDGYEQDDEDAHNRPADQKAALPRSAHPRHLHPRPVHTAKRGARRLRRLRHARGYLRVMGSLAVH